MIAKAKCKPVAWVGNWVELKPTDLHLAFATYAKTPL